METETVANDISKTETETEYSVDIVLTQRQTKQ